ncbi:MAG: RecQ family ATP-dependent DNA helicase, partial [Caldilinea sp.]|nr:RecQ family ATP-dependent DNA helicase [Caldilinea sp.]
ALVQQQQDLAEQQWHQLGGGIPVGIDRESLVLLGELAGQLGKQETARSVQRELQHRQQQELAQLQLALAPVCGAAELLQKDPAAFYRRQTGLDSVQLTEPERQQVQLAVIRHFGHLLLREGQAEVIALTWLRSQSALMVMPTGGGKSLCYQLPALLLPRTTLVISPLIALMKDQVDGLPRGMQGRAVLVNSTLDERELAKRLAAVARGEYKLVYAAPERLRQHSFLHALRRAGLDLFVVDEAHCVSLWGHDFRPDYLFIGAARLALGNPPALAVTATAPPQVRDEIAETLSDRGQKGAAHPPKVIVLDIFRPNLHLSALQFHNDDQKLVALLDYAARSEGSGIVYVNSRSRAESVALALRRAGVSAEAYHAGLALRAPIQDRFMQNQTRVIVATVAFGMGIDKPDIRFIVHFHPSRSLDAYYQEVGRAGRDGLPSQGLLFYNYNDWANLRRWARADQQSVLELRSVYAAIAAQLKVEIASAGEAAGAEQPQPAQGRITVPGSLPAAGTVDLRRLVQILNSDETELRVAVSLLERAGLLRRGFDLPTEVEIRVQGPLGPTDLADRSLARLLRGLQLGQEQSATFATAQIAAFMRWEQTECELRLLEWQEGGALSLRFGRRALWIELPEEPADFGQRLDRLLAESDVGRHDGDRLSGQPADAGGAQRAGPDPDGLSACAGAVAESAPLRCAQGVGGGHGFELHRRAGRTKSAAALYPTGVPRAGAHAARAHRGGDLAGRPPRSGVAGRHRSGVCRRSGNACRQRGVGTLHGAAKSAVAVAEPGGGPSDAAVLCRHAQRADPGHRRAAPTDAGGTAEAARAGHTAAAAVRQNLARPGQFASSAAGRRRAAASPTAAGWGGAGEPAAGSGSVPASRATAFSAAAGAAPETYTAEELSAIAGFGQSGLASAARQILAAVAASLEQQS